jgi:multiple antibiotic resistance protein
VELVLAEILNAFFLLIIIMGPFTGLPVFLKITERFDEKKRIRSANHAILFCAGLFLFFLLFGLGMLDMFGITFEGFRIAGGIVLLLIGIEYMFNLNFKEKRSGNYNTDLLVPFAMPLIIGPGTITTTIILSKQDGLFPVFVGGVVALGVYWLFLRFAGAINRRIGHQGIEILARFMGLLLMAIAVDMMKNGVVGFIRLGLGG